MHSGDPSYRFEVGDSVSIGALKNCVVDEVCEDGKYYGIKYGKDGACYGYWSWLDVRPIPTSLEAKYAQKDSPLFRMSFSNRSMNMPDSFVLNKSRIFQVSDPCCGAGCLLLAGYNAMREQLEPTDPDWDKYVLFVAQDIDPLVCKMCYIQMCCIGVPGVVVAGNSLFPDAEREPTDFWFTHKYFALDEKALENTYQQKKE